MALSRMQLAQQQHQRRCGPLLAAAAPGAAAAPAAADAAAAAHSDAAATAGAAVVEPQMSWPARTRGAGEPRAADAGQEVTVCGWVDRDRNLGGLCFFDVRDHTGLLQVSHWFSLAAAVFI